MKNGCAKKLHKSHLTFESFRFHRENVLRLFRDLRGQCEQFRVLLLSLQLFRLSWVSVAFGATLPGWFTLDGI